MRNKAFLGSIVLTVTAMIWGAAFVFQRTGMENIGPYTFASVRMVLAAVFVGILSLIIDSVQAKKSPDGAAKKKLNKNTVKGGVFGGIALCVASTLQQIGLQYTEAGKAGFITALYMLLIPLISWIFLHGKIDGQTWIAVVMGAVGLYLMCIKGDFSLALGDTYIVLCAFGFAIQILILDHFMGDADPVKLSVIEFAVTAVLTAIPAIIIEHPGWDNIISAAGPLLYCGCISGGLGYTGQSIGQKLTEPTVAGMLMSLESVFALIAGALILNETMTPKELFGCGIMFAAIILVQIPIKKLKK